MFAIAAMNTVRKRMSSRPCAINADTASERSTERGTEISRTTSAVPAGVNAGPKNALMAGFAIKAPPTATGTTTANARAHAVPYSDSRSRASVARRVSGGISESEYVAPTLMRKLTRAYAAEYSPTVARSANARRKSRSALKIARPSSVLPTYGATCLTRGRTVPVSQRSDACTPY